MPEMHHWIYHVGGLVVGRFHNESEPLRVGRDEGGEVRYDGEGREVVGVRYFERAEKGGEAFGAESQRLALDADLARKVFMEGKKLVHSVLPSFEF